MTSDNSPIYGGNLAHGGARYPNGGGKQPGAGRPTLWDRQKTLSELQKYLPKTLERQGRLAEKGDPYAGWKLINKFAPDLSSHEIGGNGTPIAIDITVRPHDSIPAAGGFITAPARSIESPGEIQNPSLAPPSPQDDHSDNQAGG